jgi:hypothetical protein
MANTSDNRTELLRGGVRKLTSDEFTSIYGGFNWGERAIMTGVGIVGGFVTGGARGLVGGVLAAPATGGASIVGLTLTGAVAGGFLGGLTGAVGETVKQTAERQYASSHH